LRIAAIVTAYHPDERLIAVIDSVLVSCAEIIVVDNTPADESSTSEKIDDPGVRVIRPGRNTGLAVALNTGIRQISADIGAVLFLDQDSVLETEVVPALAAHLADPTIGVATPAPWDAVHDRFYETFSGRHGDLDDRSIAITSGMLIRRSTLDEVGFFREDFFVDYADLEFSLRVRRTGARIVQDKRLKLPHSIGDRREHGFLGMKVVVTHHAAWRHYWTMRNGLITVREQGRRYPAWAVTALLFLGRCAVQSAMFEDGRWNHTKAVLRGVRDGMTRGTSLQYLPRGAQLSSSSRK
jgi:rhamnosyltransferase